MTVARFEHISQNQYAQDFSVCPDALPLGDIPLPRRATSGSAGYDFVCPITVSLSPGESAVIPTGIRAYIDEGWVLLLFPRSSMGFKHGLRLANTVGVIDSDYFFAQNEGHILIKLTNGGDHTVTIARGDRFVQGLLLPFGTAAEDEVPPKREGGIGSTGA